MNKPKPLNLDSEEIEELIAHKLKNLDTVIINVDEVPDIRTAIRVTIEEIKQRIKSACEFYLRYKDDPELLRIEQEIEPPEQFREYHAESKTKNVSVVSWNLQKYNEWLFRLAFKEVLKNEE